MHKTIEVKLYPTDAQSCILSDWLGICCWVYNHAISQRTKAYKRRGESITYNSQSAWLTQLRKHKPSVEAVPLRLTRSALKRVDRAMEAFFRRVKAGDRPGYPRFKSAYRFNSMEIIESGRYIRNNNMIAVPKLGLVRFRGGNRAIPAEQRLLRIVRRPSGWYAQVLIDDGASAPAKRPVESAVGIDVGLNTFATMSDGSSIENPRWGRKSYKKLRSLQRRVSRRKKGSNRRRKAVKRLARHHERIKAQRRSHAHQAARQLVDAHDLIAVEKLNIKGLARTRMAKSVLDAGWATFTTILKCKAESAGVQVVEVNPKYTSQTCPECGIVKPKKLSERTHSCECGYECDRDHAAAQVILARALAGRPVKTLAEETVTVGCENHGRQTVPVKREGSD